MAFAGCAGIAEDQQPVGGTADAKSTAYVHPCPNDPNRECVNDDPISTSVSASATPTVPLGSATEAQQRTVTFAPTQQRTTIPQTATPAQPTWTRIPPTAVPPTATRFPPTAVPPTVKPAGNCDLNYTGACIPPFPPDLNCPQVGVTDFRSVGSDPHRFDADHDGIACES
jgi:hypothetical protein